MPDEAWGKLTTIELERGQGFICARKHITTVGQDEILVRSIVALDLGVRTFVTADSVNPAANYGDGFVDRHLGGTRTVSDGSIAVVYRDNLDESPQCAAATLTWRLAGRVVASFDRPASARCSTVLPVPAQHSVSPGLTNS